MTLDSKTARVAYMFSRWISLSGVSRTHSINLRSSFRHTSADLEMSSSQKPILMAASVFIEQGTMIMPSCRNEPLEGGAAMSLDE